MTEQHPKQPPVPPNPSAPEPNFNQTWNEAPFGQMPPAGFPYPPYLPPARRKSKFGAGVLAILVPGIGHFYLGLMTRGIMVMLAIILDIFAIVQLSMSANMSIPLITLFSLLLPVIYFYSIFDALQLTDRINNQHLGYYPESMDMFGSEGDPLQSFTRGNRAGWLLIGVGALFFLLSRKPVWLTDLISTMGSYIGALILIAIGAYLFLRKNDNK